MKKFKTLTEIYSLINEVMPPLPNSPTQSVLINEWTITASDEVGGTVDLGDVDEKFYNRLRKDIINHRGGAKDLIDKLVNGGNWASGMPNREYQSKILLPVHEFCTGKDDLVQEVDIDGLKNLIKDKKSLTGFRDDLIEAIDKDTDFNFNSSGKYCVNRNHYPWEF